MSNKQANLQQSMSTGHSSSDSFSLDSQHMINVPLNDNHPSPMSRFFTALTRKKPLDCRTDTNLNRCLNLLDLTALGVGSTLGLGLYVLAGQVASNKAGPGVVVSFALAALASAFSALCYAEFAGRVPRAGSAFAYSYITVGEFVAFVIGWNMILEYVIGASSVARGFSGYLCYVYDHVIQLLSNSHPLASQVESITGPPISIHQIGFSLNPNMTSINSTAIISTNVLDAIGFTTLISSISEYVSEYFDWPSIAIIVVVTIFILIGVKGSTNVTMAFTMVNLLVVFVMVINSLGSLDLHNWRLSKTEVPSGYGEGGFLPYGWSGVLAGSATCFFGFIGFDTIASSAEEAKSPKRNVPLSILLSLFISFLAYMSVAIVQTLLWPYYDQNKVTVLPQIFSRLGMPITYWVILLGAIAGLSSSQLGGMYPLPRILYSMAHDRLIYGSLANINRRLKLPVRATIVGSVFVALLSCLLDIQDLADMVSIGTLAAYSLVSLSVLLLRYEDRRDTVDDSTILRDHLDISDIIHTLEQTNGLKIAELKRMKVSQEASLHGSVKQPPVLKDGQGLDLSRGTTLIKMNRPASSSSTRKRPSYLELLISWKEDSRMRKSIPDEQTSRQSKILISSIVVLTIIFDITVLSLTSCLDSSQIVKNPPSVFQNYLTLTLSSIAIVIIMVLIAVMLMLSRLPVSQSMPREMFKVPFVPIVPTLSILVNTFLMLNLSILTWIRFAVWMALGLFIYFTYGIRNSRGYLLYQD